MEHLFVKNMAFLCNNCEQIMKEEQQEQKQQ